MNWEDVLVEVSDENCPRPRAGHCAVGVSITTKIYSTYFITFCGFCCSLPTNTSPAVFDVLHSHDKIVITFKQPPFKGIVTLF